MKTSWDLLAARKDARPLLHESTGDHAWDADRLADLVWDLDRRIDPHQSAKLLVGIVSPRSVWGVAAIVWAWRRGHAVMLDDVGRGVRNASGLIRPDVVVDCTGAESPTIFSGPDQRRRSAPHPGLALLMGTSGSSGARKFVRLSFDNVASNAAAIARATRTGASDCAALTLPLDFAFGLSVLTSHLSSGASVALVRGSLLVDTTRWELDSVGVTTVAALPSTARILIEQDLSALSGSRITKLLVAGGKLDARSVLRAAELRPASDVDLYVMYGQAEATARMACLPPHLLSLAPGSVGRPIDGGLIEVVDDLGRPVAGGTRGNIRFSGPGVMWGYAESWDDLSRGDELSGSLSTGDVGRVVDGFLHVEGRSDRQVKVLGRRVQLEDVEEAARAAGLCDAVAAGGDADHVQLFTCRELEHDLISKVKRGVASSAGIPSGCVRLVRLDAMPLSSSGKPDHRQLAEVAAGRTSGPPGPGEETRSAR